MTSLNVPHAASSAQGARVRPAGARPSSAGEAAPGDFGAQLAEATRQSRDPREASAARRPAPDEAPSDTSPPGARADSAQDAVDAADDTAAGHDDPSRHPGRPAEATASAGDGSAAVRLQAERNAAAAGRTAARARLEGTEGSSRTEGIDGLDSGARRSGRTPGTGAAVAQRALHAASGAAAAEEAKGRQAARAEASVSAGSLPGADGAVPAQVSAPPAAVPASATAGAAAGAAGAPASTALSLAGLPTGPAAGPDAPARSAGPAEAAAHFTLSPSIDSPTFAPALGLQLSVLARDGIEQARMQLNPQEMGPIGVQLTVLGQQVQVEFTAEHARTRQVLEQSLQQLASALGDAGFTMTGGSVFQQARDGREGAQGREPGQPGQPGTGLDAAVRTAADEALAEPSASMRPRATRGLVDLYA